MPRCDLLFRSRKACNTSAIAHVHGLLQHTGTYYFHCNARILRPPSPYTFFVLEDNYMKKLQVIVALGIPVFLASLMLAYAAEKTMTKLPYDVDRIKAMSTKYGDGYTVFANDDFAISYWDPDHSFTISLYQKPLGLYRTRAEERLLQILQLPKEEVCKLPVIVAAPARVDPEGPGMYGLSFCPGSKKLPMK